MNRKIKIVIIVSTAVLIITGGAVTYGFQGVLAALGLLFLMTSAGVGIYVVRKARLYAQVLKHANWINNIEVTPVSTDDKKWIMKHLDEYFKVEAEIPTPAEIRITKKYKKEIMSHLDEFMMETQIDYNTVTPEDKRFIMENIELLFDNNREEDRKSSTW